MISGSIIRMKTSATRISAHAWYYTNDPDGGGSYGPSNVQPNGHDYDQLISIYSHVDITSTVGSFSAVSPQDKENEPENWGQLIRSSRNGRVHLYELDSRQWAPDLHACLLGGPGR